MARGTYGMMTHYLLQPKGNTPAEKTADLNRMADQFDLDHFIRQFEETGAELADLYDRPAVGLSVQSEPCSTPKSPGTRRGAMCRWRSHSV